MTDRKGSEVPDPAMLGQGRVNRAWMTAARFPVTSTVPIRFNDLDLLHHVNNVAALHLLQEARTEFNRLTGLLMVTPHWRTVVAGNTVEYAEELHYPGTVEIGTGFSRVGRTSFTFVQLARQDGKPALFARSVLVMVNADGPMELPAEVRAAYGRFLIDAPGRRSVKADECRSEQASA